MTAQLLEQAKHLPVGERVRLWDGLWASLVDDGYIPELSPAQAAELDRRISDHKKNPDDVVPWEDVKADLEARHGWKL